MVDVRQMRMFMFHWLVCMDVGMRQTARHHPRMIVIMMSIVVTVAVFVGYGFVHMFMTMLFSKE